MKALLGWAEKRTEPITIEEIDEGSWFDKGLTDLVQNPGVMSYFLWGFLNVNLENEAWEILDNIDMENGLEVWRQLTQDSTQLTEGEIYRLEDAVLAPTRVSDPAQLPQAIVRWEAAYKRYIEAGGAHVSEGRKVGAIMRIIPTSVRDKTQWDMELFKDSSATLKK